MNCEYEDKIFGVDQEGFADLALQIFQFQYKQNPVYKQYVDTMNVDPGKVRSIEELPFLPIQFFKTHDIKTTSFEPQAIFESSGTTGGMRSRHFIKDLSVYRRSFLTAFELFYGPVQEWCFIGLLPSYLERNNSSLVVMVDELIKKSTHTDSGFYLHDYQKLSQVIQKLEAQKQKTVLIGVTFALLDFVAQYPMALQHTRIMETGGMKGRRRELTRLEVHHDLKQAFGLLAIDAEYGMTELLSQAYSYGDGIFSCPPWMKIVLREEDDPLHIIKAGDELKVSSGILNIIDLANLYSCSFIATDDIGKLNGDGSFEVIGRIDDADLRGCSLMVG